MLSNADFRAYPNTHREEVRRKEEWNRTVSVRLNEKEKKHLKKQADAAELKKEPFIRKLIMGVEIHPCPPENVVLLLREIKR